MIYLGESAAPPVDHAMHAERLATEGHVVFEEIMAGAGAAMGMTESASMVNSDAATIKAL